MLNSVRHSFRNVWRNKMRTIVVLIIIAISVTLVMGMATVDAGIKNQVQKLEESVGTGIEVRPAGSFGGFGRGGMLDGTILDSISEIPNVASIERSFISMLAPSDMIQQAPQPGSGGPSMGRGFGMMIMGVEPGDTLTVFGGGSAEVSEGRNFEASDLGQNVLIVGEALAESNGWVLGDIVELEGEIEFTIIGIATSDTRFGASGLFMPLDTAQTFTGQEGMLSQARVVVDRLENVDAVVAVLKEQLGEEIDIVAEKERLLAPVQQILTTIETVTRAGVVIALIAAGIVVFATMIITVKERTREIGILKAIGASRTNIVNLFTMEALTIVMISLVLGSAMFLLTSDMITSKFIEISMPETTSNVRGQMGQVVVSGENLERARQVFGGGGFGGRGAMFGQAGVSAVLGDLEISLDWKTIGISWLAILLISIIGSLIPAAYAARMKPTEVLRNE